MSEVKFPVYLLRNNYVDLTLLSNDSPVDLDSITKIELLSPVSQIDSESNPEYFSWVNQDLGHLRLSLGSLVITPGVYNYQLILYDIINTRGIVWGELVISFIAKTIVV